SESTVSADGRESPNFPGDVGDLCLLLCRRRPSDGLRDRGEPPSVGPGHRGLESPHRGPPDDEWRPTPSRLIGPRSIPPRSATCPVRRRETPLPYPALWPGSRSVRSRLRVLGLLAARLSGPGSEMLSGRRDHGPGACSPLYLGFHPRLRGLVPFRA